VVFVAARGFEAQRRNGVVRRLAEGWCPHRKSGGKADGKQTQQLDERRFTMKAYPQILMATVFLAGCNAAGDPSEERTQVATKELKTQPERAGAYPEALQRDNQRSPCGPCVPTPGNCGKKDARRMQEAYDNPVTPTLRPDDTFYGHPTAPLLLVVYLDFQCHYCARGERTVAALRTHYGDKLRVVYKHLPLGFHRQARRAAEYHEAVRLQSAEKALRFGRLLFAQQARVKEGDAFLEEMARVVGAEMTRLRADVDSRRVRDRISQDLQEARRFGIRGTPTYLINGVRLVGARSKAHFIKVVDELVRRKMVTL
jgi:protein-disulfide isomerase